MYGSGADRLGSTGQRRFRERQRLRQTREGAVSGSAAGLRRGRKRVGGVEEGEANVMVAEVAELPLPGQPPCRSAVIGSGIVEVGSGGKRFSGKRHRRGVIVGERGLCI